MKNIYPLIAVLFLTQLSSAAEPTFIDDAPKGFIHIANESTDYYLRTDAITQLEQSFDDKTGAHYVRLYAANSALLLFKTKEEADKCMKRLFELLTNEK